ncbi:TBC1 domain family member 16 [Condylostylus longicornis]|uniref:TBC1 domain family member 16 n=1 Tax=Condylostylus longicornis TaxID=2530218 RepID=UPI00244E2BA1|nr:TBC1 domain family member 16 [Condylostylus longicornis]
MPIADILKKASEYILGNDKLKKKVENVSSSIEENEVIFCKNNVCVHPQAPFSEDVDVLHCPGYVILNTKTFVDQHNGAKRSTLLFTWIPNSTLKKCQSLENEKNQSNYSTYNNQKNNKKSEELVVSERNSIKNGSITRIICNNTNPFIEPYYVPPTITSTQSVDECTSYSNADGGYESTDDIAEFNRKSRSCENVQVPFDNNEKELTGNSETSEDMYRTEAQELQPLLSNNRQNIRCHSNPFNSKRKITVNITIANPCIENIHTPLNEIDIARYKKLCATPLDAINEDNSIDHYSDVMDLKYNSSSESSSTSPASIQKNYFKCKRFSIDLSQMRSLRLFFNDERCTSGHFVITSRENQLKVLHFHYGGLDHLAQVLHQWHCILHNVKLVSGQDQEDSNLFYKQFLVCRPEIKQLELHPDEGKVNKITTDSFYGIILNEKGQIEDEVFLRKSIFFGGLEKCLRKTVWPFLLHCYLFSSTFEDRAHLANIRMQEYEEICRRRNYTMSPEEQAQFWRAVQCVIEKDIIETEHRNPSYLENDKVSLEKMKNILLNYAYYSNGKYTQGMSDLLAPILVEINNESEAFWCFVGLMQKPIFAVRSFQEDEIKKNIKYLRELIRIMLPRFNDYLKEHCDDNELLFCHRWLLQYFKREFTESIVIQMWEACWSNYLTDFFHLFLCLSITAVYAEDVISQNLNSNEMILHFHSLAMYMDGELILRKARGLLHHYRQLSKIPCTLSGLCKRCGPGIWDSAHQPAVECIGHVEEEKCALAVD